MKEHKRFIVTACVVALIIIAIAAVFFILLRNKGSIIPEAIEIKSLDPANTVELNINDNLPVQLAKIPLKYNNIGTSAEESNKEQLTESFYKDGKITFGKLSDDEKIIAVLNNVDEQDIITTDLQSFGAKRLKAFEGYSDEQIQETYYDVPDEENIASDGMLYTAIQVYNHDVLEKTAVKIFGEDGKKINWKSIYSGGMGYDVEYIDGNYYRYHYRGGGLGNCTYGYSELEKAEQNEDYIFLYDKFLFANEYDSMINADGQTKYYLSSTMGSEIADVVHSEGYNTEVEHSKEEIYQDYLMNNKDKFNTYKHTLKKDSDGNYHWISTEITNISD